MKKKLMILGGSRYAIPVIKKAHELGLYVITCDYLPDNAAHKFSDRYVNVSIVDKEAVLSAAKECNIDGIISFACDPGVVTAAYVAEQLKLPFQCSYDSAVILQDKGKFRDFLTRNGFNSPKSRRYTHASDAMREINSFKWPVMVKPTDSAGSKGVTRVDDEHELPQAIEKAIEESHNGAFIIEDFIVFEGEHSSTDPFTVDGEIKFITYSDQLFDPNADNPYVPAYIIWPCSMKRMHQDYLTSEIQRLMKLLDVKTGIYNIESCVGIDGKPYIMEVSPRGGGCKIAEIQELSMGAPLIENEIRKAVGMELIDIPFHECDGVWCEMIIHSKNEKEGKLKRISIDEEVEKKHVVLTDYSVNPGDLVKPFTGANMSLGDMFLHFENIDQMNEILARSDDWLRIELCET